MIINPPVPPLPLFPLLPYPQQTVAQAPPLAMEVSTFQMAATKATDGLLLSTTCVGDWRLLLLRFLSL